MKNKIEFLESIVENFVNEVYYDTPRYMSHRASKLSGGSGSNRGYGWMVDHSRDPKATELSKALGHARIAIADVKTIAKHHAKPEDEWVASDLGATAAIGATNAVSSLRKSGITPAELKKLADYERTKKTYFGK